MIQGFQQQTQPLSQYEQEILVPIVVRGLQTKVTYTVQPRYDRREIPSSTRNASETGR